MNESAHPSRREKLKQGPLKEVDEAKVDMEKAVWIRLSAVVCSQKCFF